MRLILLGPPGAGKGTQSEKILVKYNLKHISTGDLLRAVEGDLKTEVNDYMSSGKLVPDELIVRILKCK